MTSGDNLCNDIVILLSSSRSAATSIMHLLLTTNKVDLVCCMAGLMGNIRGWVISEGNIKGNIKGNIVCGWLCCNMRWRATVEWHGAAAHQFPSCDMVCREGAETPGAYQAKCGTSNCPEPHLHSTQPALPLSPSQPCWIATSMLISSYSPSSPLLLLFSSSYFLPIQN